MTWLNLIFHQICSQYKITTFKIYAVSEWPSSSNFSISSMSFQCCFLKIQSHLTYNHMSALLPAEINTLKQVCLIISYRFKNLPPDFSISATALKTNHGQTHAVSTSIQCRLQPTWRHNTPLKLLSQDLRAGLIRDQHIFPDRFKAPHIHSRQYYIWHFCSCWCGALWKS